MHTHSHKLWLGRLFALAPIALAASGCFDAVVGEGELCLEAFDGGGCEDDGGPYSDAGGPYSDAGGPYSDAGPGDRDAGPKRQDCYFEGEAYPPGWFLPNNECKCVCLDYGEITCNPECVYSDAGGAYTDGGWASADGGWYTDGGWVTDGGWPSWDASADGGPTYYDAGLLPDAGWTACPYGDTNFSGTILTKDGCNTCTCFSDGKMSCTNNGCLPDGGAGGCFFRGEWKPVGTSLFTGDRCDVCGCVADGQLSCESKACGDGSSTPPGDAGVWGGTCDYYGKQYQLGEYVPTATTCAKCHCAQDAKAPGGGTVVCETSGCTTSSGCTLGETRFSLGEVVTCADGCNTCTCGSKTDNSNWFASKASCPALPAIMACPASASSSAFPAQLVYREGDALAVVDSRCVNGQTLDYTLCWEGDLSKGNAQLYVFSSGTQRACNANLGERVFSLLPLRQALVTALPGQPFIKAGLQGSDSWFNYEFTAP